MAAARKSRGRGSAAAAKASSVRELAAALGLSHTAVAKWARDDRWPFGKSGPWDVEKVRAWAARSLKPDAAAGGDGGRRADAGELSLPRKVELALKNVKREAAQFDLDVKKGVYHRTSECTARQARRVEEAKKRLCELADGLPFEPDVKELVRNRMFAVLRELAALPRAGA